MILRRFNHIKIAYFGCYGKFLLPILLLTVFYPCIFAQGTQHRIECLARVKGDSIVLRWVPASIPAWQTGNKYGYVIHRYTIARNGEMFPDGLTNGELLTPHPIQPAPESVFESLSAGIPEAGIVQEAIYGKDFRMPDPENGFIPFLKSYRELEARFGFSLFVCDISPKIAEAAGLYYADANVRTGERYAYRIAPAQQPQGLEIRPAVKVVDAGQPDVIPVPDELLALPGDQAITLRWPVFHTANGAEYKGKTVASDKGRVTVELTLPAARANDGYELYALHPVYATHSSGYRYDMLGKLTVVSYAVETPRLSLVAVNGNTLEKGAVKSYLDRVYLPVGVNWQVSETEFDYDMPRDSLDVTGSGMFSRYTPAMKRMNAAFMQRASLDNTSGDMPRGCQFGYIFTGAITDAGSGMSKNDIIGRTVAHELGHGTFKLRHTFDSEYRIAKATTENLMDYSWGRDLVKHQWDAIHAPGLVIGLFERDEDAMMAISQKITYAILVSGKELSEKDIKNKTLNEIRETSNVYLVDCDEQVKALFNGADEYKPPVIYYFGEKPDLKLYSVSVDKNEKFSLNSSHETESNAVHFKNSANSTLKFEIRIEQGDPKLLYNSAEAGKNPSGAYFIDHKVTVYGAKQFGYQMYFTQGDRLPPFIKSITWNEDEPKYTGFADWTFKEINPDSQENKITITPVFGQPVVYAVHFIHAPVLTVSSINHDDGTVGLDNWELYKGINRNPGLNGFYKETFTADNKEKTDHFLPFIVITPNSPSTISMNLKMANMKEINGTCQYIVEYNGESDIITLSRNGTTSLDIKNMQGTVDYIYIRDMYDHLKGKIKIVRQVINKTLKYRIVKFKYIDAEKKEHKALESNLGNLNQVYAQLGITWEEEIDKEGEKEVLITDHNIAEVVQKLKISAARVKQYLTGTQVNESDKEDYKNVLIRLYQLGKMSKPGVYDIIFMPYRLGVNGFAIANGSTCFISPSADHFTVAHELGHNLGLPHIGKELGICGDDDQETGCEANVKSNNIMGYDQYSRNSFWHWQSKIKK
ncbi:MAG: hypothetical protein LBL04_03950 [Bacteroidales bacterium]|nr:hypothetical protein [Bacteroidales bacterium]